MTLVEHIIKTNEELDGDLKKYYDTGHFQFIERDGTTIGYFTYDILFRHSKVWCFITNLYIEPDYRRKDNLLFLRRYMQERVDADIFYWKEDKHDRFIYGKRRIVDGF